MIKSLYWKLWGLLMDWFIVKKRMTIYGGENYKEDVYLTTVKCDDGLWWSGYYTNDGNAATFGRGSRSCGCNDYHRSRAIAYKHITEEYITSEKAYKRWLKEV